jgi:hypothetical protein
VDRCYFTSERIVPSPRSCCTSQVTPWTRTACETVTSTAEYTARLISTDTCWKTPYCSIPWEYRPLIQSVVATSLTSWGTSYSNDPKDSPSEILGEALAEWKHPDFRFGAPKKGGSDLDFSRVGKKSTKIKPLFGFAFLVHLTSLLPVQVSRTLKNDNILRVTEPLYRECATLRKIIKS